MSPLVYALLAIVAVGAAGFALVPSLLGSSRAGKRMKALQGDVQANRRENNAERDRDSRRKTVQQALKTQNDALAKTRKRPSVQALIFQAGMKIKASAFIRNQVIVGVVIFVVLFLVEVPPLYALIIGGAGGYVLPRWYLGRRRKK